MHPQQKAAWFVLIIIVLTIVLYALTVPPLSWSLGRPWGDVAEPATGIFGLFGLCGFARVFLTPRSGKLVMDERDHQLSARAWRAGMAMFWMIFVFVGISAWVFLRYVRGVERVTLPVEFFPAMIFAGAIIATLAQSIATLHYYGWRADDASSR